MAGSIRPRKDRGPDAWELRVFIGSDSRGRPKQKSTLFRGTKRAAERELARLVLLQDEKPAPVLEDDARAWGPATTVNDAIAGWRDNGWQDLSPNTVRGYEGVWRRHVQNSIGRRKIAALGPYDVEKYLRELQYAGAGRTTLRLVRALLHRACRLARKWSGNTLPNPVADTELPRMWGSESPRPVRSPTIEEVRAILVAAEDQDPRVATFVRLIAATGCRRGEACAVRFEDIDHDRRLLTIDEGVINDGRSAAARPTKTQASVRRMELDSGTLAALVELSAIQERMAGACDMRLSERSFVFSFEPGGAVPPHPDSMSHAFRRACEVAGVSADVHLHSLRHFQATILDPVIPERQKQARLGWSTSRMARHYTDPIADQDRLAADFVGGVLDGENEAHPA